MKATRVLNRTQPFLLFFVIQLSPIGILKIDSECNIPLYGVDDETYPFWASAIQSPTRSEMQNSTFGNSGLGTFKSTRLNEMDIRFSALVGVIATEGNY